jgi:hypothetical protein
MIVDPSQLLSLPRDGCRCPPSPSLPTGLDDDAASGMSPFGPEAAVPKCLLSRCLGGSADVSPEESRRSYKYASASHLSGKSVRLFGIKSHGSNSERSNPVAPKVEICVPFQADLGRPVLGQKIFCFAFRQFAGFLFAFHLTERGVRAIVTTREAEMRWTR